VRALLVAMVLCAMTDTALLATCFTDVLFRRISPAMRHHLGVPAPPDPLDPADRWGYRNVRTRLHRLLGLVDPSPLPKNRRLAHDRFVAMVELRRAGLSAAAWDERADRLAWFVNALLELSIRTLSRDVRRQWRGSVAVDATVVPAFARHDRRVTRRRKAEAPEVITHSVDPDADWYIRGDPDASAESGPSKASIWGFEASLVVTGADGDEEPGFPSLCIGMAPLHKPSHDPGGNAIRALASIHARGHPAGYLAGDRAYTSAKAENFQLPARALDYRLVLDYTRPQLGLQGDYHGMVLIEGAWYCPSIPEKLITATVDFEAKAIDEPTYLARLAERWRYQVLPKAGADDESHVRVRCPASEPSPVARCALKPKSLRLNAKSAPVRRVPLTVPVKTDVAAFPPKICTQQSITLPPEEGAKYVQELLYRSERWSTVYHTLRNGIEGFNGYVKDGNHEALDDPERRRIRGVAAQSVFVALLLMAANLRKIRTFMAELTAQKAGKLRRLPSRRRTRGLDTWLPDVNTAVGMVDPAVRPQPPPRTA